MCYNCGCHIPQDNMGHDDNITTHTFHHLAEEWKVSDAEAKKITLDFIKGNDASGHEDRLNEVFEKAAKAWGQSVDEAKKNTLDLLGKEVKE